MIWCAGLCRGIARVVDMFFVCCEQIGEGVPPGAETLV